MSSTTRDTDTQAASIDVASLLRSGIDIASGPYSNSVSLQRIATNLTQLERSGLGSTVTVTTTEFIDDAIDRIFEKGWQPTELAHAVRRELDSAAVKLTVAAIGLHTRRTQAWTSAPEPWREQLDELDINTAFADAFAWRSARNVVPEKFWRTVLVVLGYVQTLPGLPSVVSAPSAWGRTVSPSHAKRPDTKVLAKIRGLLAKAESTTFAAEAETLSAKAQELMTRYSIDAAVLDARARLDLGVNVITRRMSVATPYPDMKATLLDAVCRNNGGRSVFHKSVGLVSLVGMPVDLDLCELLYTSLLVQSSRSMEEVGQDPDKRSSGFRRAFLLSFALRIGERLAEVRANAERAASEEYGKGLVPVIAKRSAAVQSKFVELFPDVTRRKSTTSNASGWREGRSAADRADLSGGPKHIRK